MIIAGAGGAAHLPGMVAAATPLPVIGVPVPLRVLDGLDSLLSIVQMPAGVPVATVAVGGARNAGLLAVRILAAADAELRARMAAFQADAGGVGAGEGRGAAGAGRRPTPGDRRPVCGGATPLQITEFTWRDPARAVVGWRYTGEEVVLRCIATGLVRWLSASTTGR